MFKPRTERLQETIKMAGLGEYEENEGGEGRKAYYKLSPQPKPTIRPELTFKR